MRISEKIAIAAHLHVLLRRKTGRVTDTEWMALNADYAAEIVRFARVKAVEDGHPDLADWADKLERATVEEPVRRPILGQVQSAAPLRAAPIVQAQPEPEPLLASEQDGGFFQSVFGESGFADSGPGGRGTRVGRDPNAPRYVGGIR